MGRSHKETNTYRFQNFTERMKLMHIDVVHQIRKKVDEDDGEDATYFGNALTNWIDLNCTQNFDDFKEDLQPYPCSTYVLLVHHSKSIIEVLQKHLVVPGTLALEPLLDLLVQLARDMGPDFYQYFQGVFEILVQVLGTCSKDPDSMEKIFTTMAYLYKFLWRYLVKNIYTVYGYFSALLTHSKEYIQRFSSESFAFLMRKVKDQDALVQFLFADLENNSEKTEGVGQLLFEMMKGVKENFHTISEQVFRCILKKLGPSLSQEAAWKALPYAVVEETVRYTMAACADYSTQQKAAHLWNVLLEVIGEVHASCSQTKTAGQQQGQVDERLAHLCRLLRLTTSWLTHHHGNIVSDPAAVAKVVLTILKDVKASWSGVLAVDLLSVVSSLLLNCAERLTVETTARLVSLVFSSHFTLEQVKEFTMSLFDSPLFEKDVLPGLLNFMVRDFESCGGSVRRDMVCLLADIVMRKRPCPEDGSQIQALAPYVLDFSRVTSRSKSGVVQYIQRVAEQGADDWVATKGTQELSELLSALVCLPNISVIEAKMRVKTMVTAWQKLKQMLPETMQGIRGHVMYVMHQAMLGLLSLRSEVTVQDVLPPDQVFSLLKSWPEDSALSDNYYIVHAADLYLTWMSDLDHDDLLTSDLLAELYPLLEPNLVSWSHKVRLTTLHLLTLFPVNVPVPASKDSQEDQWTAFTLALAAERVPLTVRDYRQRLLYLRKLDHDLVHSVMPAGPYTKMPLLYLVGTLLCPMTLLWEPVSELIASHARGLPRDDFWNAFSHWLTLANDKAVEPSSSQDGGEAGGSQAQSLLERRLALERSSERPPDYHAFRNLLWRTMALFPEKCEPKSRELVPLFLHFLKKEYYKTDMTMAPSQDITMETTATSRDDTDVDPDDTVADDDDEEEEEVTEVKGKKTSGKVQRKSAVQSLLAHLQVFSKMQNPRSLYKEEELRDIFFQFLEHKNSGVQKAAFKCIMTYKYKFLTPYRENFERLLDDKTFKTEVVLFSVDRETTDISAQHRQDLLPFLMRILYGKMLSKAGNETSGKRRADVRRSIVFRFLGGCSSAELQYFLDLVFGPFKAFVTDDPVKMVKKASTVDLKNCLPPKRMKGVLGAVLVVVDKLGHLLQDNAGSILHLLMGVAAASSACLHHREVIKPSAAAMLKSARQMAFHRAIQFFKDFDDLQLTEEESNAILDAFVWPQLERLNLESKCQPSLLLKMLQCWCQHPKYFHLLTKQPEKGVGKGEQSALQAMFSLLGVAGLGLPVSSVILGAVDSLLTGEEEHEAQGEEGERPRKRRKIVKSSEPSQGVLLVRPHVPTLLGFIEDSIRTLGAQLEKDRKTSASRDTILELKILARVSMYIEDEEQSVRLCLLLMPFLSGSITLQQDLEESSLESMLNLMKTVKNPRRFFRPLVPLFNSIERRQSRVLLCQILKAIGSKVPELQEIGDIVEKLNAWNPRQAEEPDYTDRLEAFRTVTQTLKEWTVVNVDFLLPLIYNCCFFIRAFDDLSLRDNSTFCMVTMIQRLKALTSDPALYKELVADTILPHMKKGLRSKQQAVRHEFLAVLQALVLAFPDHREFQGMTGLRDTDIEADFFENIKHIQVHKQAKALRRLSHYLHSHKLRADQHMGFFLPLLYSYLLDKTYARSGKMMDAAVDLTCMMCRQLPWENYYQLLRLYLSHLPRHLDNQRIIIRVIVAILDAFHFDLAQSQFKYTNKPKLNQSAAAAEAEEEGDQTEMASEQQAEKSQEGSAQEGKDNNDDDDDALSSLEAAVVSAAAAEGQDGSAAAADQSLEFSADRKDMCAPGLATRIHRMVLQSLIPQLHKTLTEKVKSDDMHKLAGTKYAEDEEVLRVPIAMAMIKLLQKLPDGALDHKLPGIMLRVCNFLKSRAQDIRMTARDTLVKAVQSIGPRYLPFILKEMRAVLLRGYQRHVLSFSVYHLLKSITAILKPGDLDRALDDLHAVYQDELFGAVAEEKTVDGITSKLFEAKTIKGYLAYKLMAQYVSPDCLGALVLPLKKLLEGTHSQRVANKVRMVLQSVTTGLLANTAINTTTLMVFVHSLTADNLPLLREPKETTGVLESSGLAKPQKPESCLLLPKATPRGGIKPKTNKKTTLDVLVEFGLVLLHACLKNGTLKATDPEHLGYLEPMVLPIMECLALKYVRVNCAVLRVLEWLLVFPLPTLRKKINAVASRLFLLLRNYATAGAAKGDNQELVFMCFKAVTVLVRDVKYHKLTKEHLQVLLTYCEEDIHDHTRQSTAFSVIKAILKRRLNVPELHQLLSTVETMSITADASHLKVQCREVVVQYLRDYPLGKKLEGHFAFYIRQLTYEHEEGRLSALRLLRAVFSSFDEDILQKYCGLFFIPLATCMFADVAVACRELAVATIKTLLEKIDTSSRDKLFSMVQGWLTEDKLPMVCIGVQLCSVFVEVETAGFLTRRDNVLPALLDRDVTDDSESDQDKFYFLLMTLVRKLMTAAVDLSKLSEWTDISKVLDFVQSHLLHNHSWVRLLTCQIMGLVLSCPADDILAYLTPPKAKQLVMTMCIQLQSPLLDEDLALQIMKNMATVARAYHHAADPAGPSVLWMAKKLIKEANYESINNPQVTIKRTHVFKWVAFVSQEFDVEDVKPVVDVVLPALVREADGMGKDETVKQLSAEVMDWLKKKVGVEAFSTVYTAVQEKRRETKEKRKQKRAIDAVNNPEIAAAKRMKKNRDRKKPVREERKQRKKKTKLSVFH